MHFHGKVRTIWVLDFEYMYMIILVTSRFILICCYLFVVVGIGKWGMSGTLPSYEVLRQRNVTMFAGCDFFCLYTRLCLTAEAIRTTVAPISILIRTTVVPVRILIRTTGM